MVLAVGVKQTRATRATTDTEEKWNEFPATFDALCGSETGRIGTPMASAWPALTGRPKQASLSRPVIQVSLGTWYILPVFIRKVGTLRDVADQHNRFSGLSPRKANKCSSFMGSVWKRFL